MLRAGDKKSCGVRLLTYLSFPRPARPRSSVAASACYQVKLGNLTIFQQLVGVNRGIFGVKAAKSEAIEILLSELQRSANNQRPTEDLAQLSGKWNLIYTSLVIKGAQKTKLGLREFVSLGDFEQIIDNESKTATNRVHFSVTGLGNLSGSLTIIAKFEPVSAKRVQITYESAALVPKALERLFASNYDMLLSIFNPEGWLDITYLDDTHRVGRDDKGNVFYLQRS
ncbi:hypothetical protein WJX79_004731 [Trebouxia sp. C0005]